MDTIKAKPTPGLSYNPSEAKYWEPEGLSGEIERVFDICHGCRLCFNLCPSFPALFDAVDRHDGDVRKLEQSEVGRVVDLCFQCKLCYVKCPYTADDGHEFNLDFPRLMQRYTAQHARKHGVGAREKMLGNPVALGALASKVAGLANWANRTRFHRVVMEKMTGIHRDKKLPEFAAETFEKWMARRPKRAARPAATSASAVAADASATTAADARATTAADARAAAPATTAEAQHAVAPAAEEVVLFHTCFVNYNNPGIGKDAVEVLERAGIVVLSPEQTCCGMPALDGGDFDFAREQARRNVKSLTPYAERGCKILAINPTCSYTLRKEYAELVGADLEADAKKVAAATRDLMEFVNELKRDGRLDRDFRSTPGEVAYHVPCHLKAQNIGYRSRDAMKAIPGAKVRVVDGCCGHNGTWAMKKENFELSLKIGAPTFAAMQEGGVMATDCPLAAIQFEQATGTKPIHPVQVLAMSYRENGFPTPVSKEEEK